MVTEIDPITDRPPIAIQPVIDRSDEFAGAAGEVRFLELPTRPFVFVDGQGAPAQAVIAARLPALYTTAWKLHFALKSRGVPTRVGPLEGLWWTLTQAWDIDRILAGRRDDWRWTLGIALPEQARDDELTDAVEAGRAKVAPELARSVRIEWFDEGRVAQVLHLGPYDAERPTIELLHQAIADAGLRPAGRHHEIYLGDPRRAAPEKLRTILRQPVA